MAQPHLGRAGTGPAVAMVLTRRRLLAGMLLAPPLLAGCSAGKPAPPPKPDPLVALASSARSDAALAAAAIAAKASLAEQLEPLRAARVEHATALDAEIVRASPSRTPPPAPSTAPTAAQVAGQPVTIAQLRDAVAASAKAAATAALDVSPARAGLVASVAACCSTYAAVLA